MPVYFAVAGPFVKIGWSRYPDMRLAHLQIGCPYRMSLAATVPGGPYLERQYHLRFIYLAVEGRWGVNGPNGLPFPVNEWFHLTGELAEYVDHLAAGGAPLWTGRRIEDEWYPSTAFHPPEQRAEILRREASASPWHDQMGATDGIDDLDDDGGVIPF